MENKQYREAGMGLATLLLFAFEPVFATENFYNATEMKRWLGNEIKGRYIGGYRNLEWKEYKVIFDLILSDKQTYHVGVDFGQQAVHVTLGPADIYSLYFRNPSVSE